MECERMENMKYTTEGKVDETSELKYEIECLTARRKEAEETACKMEQINKDLRGEISDLKAKVRFYEGQIEAYKFCLKCTH